MLEGGWKGSDHPAGPGGRAGPHPRVRPIARQGISRELELAASAAARYIYLSPSKKGLSPWCGKLGSGGRAFPQTKYNTAAFYVFYLLFRRIRFLRVY